MRDLKRYCNIALVQAEPVMFDKGACVKKVVEGIREAGKNGAELIVFPELFISGYPYGMTFGFTIGKRTEEGRKDWYRYYDSSMVVPGEETEEIGRAVKEVGAYVSIGISERDAVTSTLYNSNIIFSPDGKLAAVHRKLKPTGTERLVWGDGNRNYFPVADTPWGPAGALICWESYMPLARVALYEKGITLYIAPNTNSHEGWHSTIKHIAMEGRCYFINSNMIITKKNYPKDLNCPEELEKLPEIPMPGGSCVVDPYGNYATEPVWNREEIIYARLDMEKVPASRMEFDPCGHYARPDVLELKVHETVG